MIAWENNVPTIYFYGFSFQTFAYPSQGVKPTFVCYESFYFHVSIVIYFYFFFFSSELNVISFLLKIRNISKELIILSLKKKCSGLGVVHTVLIIYVVRIIY